MQTEPSDQGLMSELAGGRESPLGELMRRWQGRVLCFIDRLCGYLGRNDDVFQEVWTRIYLYRKRYDPRRPFRPFLFAVVLNCCRTALAARGSVPPAAGPPRDVHLSDLPFPGDDPPAKLIWAEQCRQLHQAIARLSEVQRSVVLLYLLYDSDYRQIAQVLDKSVQTVRTNMHYALRTLRSRLERMSDLPRTPAGEARCRNDQ